MSSIPVRKRLTDPTLASAAPAAMAKSGPKFMLGRAEVRSTERDGTATVRVALCDHGFLAPGLVGIGLVGIAVEESHDNLA